MKVEVLGFDDLKCLYETDIDFAKPWKACKEHIVSDKCSDYFIQEDMLFKGVQLSIPRGSMRENIIKEKHSGGFVGHFGIDKTVNLISERYFWLHIYRDVQRMVKGVCTLKWSPRLWAPI